MHFVLCLKDKNIAHAMISANLYSINRGIVIKKL